MIVSSRMLRFIAVAGLALLDACGGSKDSGTPGGGTPPPAVTISVAPANPSVQTSATAQFTATVGNASNTAVTWLVNDVTGGSTTTGTISTSGLYTAPATVPSPATVTVKAIAVADTTKFATSTVTITAPAPPPAITVTVAPATASIAVNGAQHFTATVANSTNTAVTWSVSGTGCSAAACGTITSGGDYTAPATVPSPATVTVKAISAADTTKSGTATVTVTAAAPPANPLALLNGRFVITTIDQERNGFVTGTLDFDGAGHVTAGAVDLNIPEATAQTTISSGTYTVGSDGRGRVALTVTGVGTVHFSFVVVSSSLARIMYYEPTSTGDLFGTLEKQTATATPTGKYVFHLEGTGLTGRRGYVGLLDFGASTGQLDFTEPVPTGFAHGYGTTAVGTATVTLGAADSKGRGTLTIASTETGTMQFAYWVIGASKLAIIPLDPVAPIIANTSGAKPASGGIAEKQGTIQAAGNLATGNYVFTAMGYDSVGVFDKGGRIVSTGASTADITTDHVGPLKGQQLDVLDHGCTTTLSAAGRSDIFCSTNNYGLRVFFIDTGHAYALVYDSVNAAFGIGELYKQSAATYANSDLAGGFALLGFGDETANNVTGAIAVASGGTLSGTQDTSEDGVQRPDLAVTGTYTLNTNGTGETVFTAGGKTNQHRYWVASANKVMGFTINDPDRESFILERQNLTGP